MSITAIATTKLSTPRNSRHKRPSSEFAAIPEHGELDTKKDPVIETIQNQYVETKTLMEERMVSQDLHTVLDIVFKFNSLTAVDGHSEKEVMEKDIISKSPTNKKSPRSKKISKRFNFEQ
jgi:hypothetical protein